MGSNQNQEEIDKLIKDFDPNKVPANLKLAEIHQRAKKIGIPKNLKHQSAGSSKVCPCCGNQIEKVDVEFTADNINLGFLGSGIPLYYQFLKFGVVFLLIIFIVSGIHGLQQNKAGQGCELQTLLAQSENDPQSECRMIYQNIYSTSNSISIDQLTTQDTYGGLNILTTIALMIACVCFRRAQNVTITHIDQNNVTARDFTIMFELLPIGITKQELETYIEKQMGPFIKSCIRKIVLAYDIDKFIKLQRDLAAQSHIKGSLESKKSKGQTIEEDKLKEAIEKIQTIQGEIDQLQKQVQGEDQGFKSCGTAFVTFEKDENVEFVEATFRMNFLERFILENFCDSKKKINGKIPIAVRAPEPSDIYWENLSTPLEDKVRRRIITNFASVICIGACFGILYGMSLIQESIRKGQDTANFGIQLISLLMGFLIAFVNNVLAIIIRHFAVMEKHITYTNYLSSVAKKLGVAQFLNTAIIQLIVFRIQSGDKFMIEGGLNQDMIWIAITNAGIPILFGILNPWYFYRLYKRNQFKEGKLQELSQIEVNKIFEGPPFDVSSSYAQAIKTLMLCCFYAYLLPLIPAIGAAGLILYYILDKILIINRYHVPYSIGSQISEDMTDFFLEMMILIHAIGCLLFENYIFDKITGYSVTQIVLSSIYYLIPIEKFCECCVKIQRTITQESYTQVGLMLSSDYDRANPVTQEQAMESWMTGLTKLAGGTDEDIRKIQEQRAAMAGGNRFGGLMNYAQTRQTINQINQANAFGMGNRFFGAGANFRPPVFQPAMGAGQFMMGGPQIRQMNFPGQNGFFNQQMQLLQNNPAVQQMFLQRQMGQNQMQNPMSAQNPNGMLMNSQIQYNQVKTPALQNPMNMNPQVNNRVVPQQDQNLSMDQSKVQNIEDQNLIPHSQQPPINNINLTNSSNQNQFQPQQNPSGFHRPQIYGQQQPQQFQGQPQQFQGQPQQFQGQPQQFQGLPQQFQGQPQQFMNSQFSQQKPQQYPQGQFGGLQSQFQGQAPQQPYFQPQQYGQQQQQPQGGQFSQIQNPIFQNLQPSQR